MLSHSWLDNCYCDKSNKDYPLSSLVWENFTLHFWPTVLYRIIIFISYFYDCIASHTAIPEFKFLPSLNDTPFSSRELKFSIDQQCRRNRISPLSFSALLCNDPGITINLRRWWDNIARTRDFRLQHVSGNLRVNSRDYDARSRFETWWF